MWGQHSHQEDRRKNFSTTQAVLWSTIAGSDSTHSGDWLLAPPITAVGLRMTNETVRIATGMRLGISICEHHLCLCEKQVESRGLHGLLCCHSAARISRHNMVNDIVWRVMQRVKIPAANKPPGLLRSNNKRPDGVTLISWKQGKCLTDNA